MIPSPFLGRYLVNWIVAQTAERAEQAVIEEVKARIASGDLGNYEGALFKDAFKSNRALEAEFRRVELGVIAATKAELVGLLDKMRMPKSMKIGSLKLYYGKLLGRRLAIVESGNGFQGTRDGLTALLRIFHPSRVASIGFAKSLNPKLTNGVIFVPERILREDGSVFELNAPARPVVASEDAPQALTAEPCAEVATAPTTAPATEPDATVAPDADPEVEGVLVCAPVKVEERVPEPTPEELEFLARFRTGRLISLDSGRPAPEIRELGDAYDHETLAVAEFCAEFGVPFLTLRATYEASKATGVSREAKKVVASNQSFARSLGAFLGATMKKPSAALDVYKIKQEELQAADKLADALSRVVSTLRIEEPDVAPTS